MAESLLLLVFSIYPELMDNRVIVLIFSTVLFLYIGTEILVILGYWYRTLKTILKKRRLKKEIKERSEIELGRKQTSKTTENKVFNFEPTQPPSASKMLYKPKKRKSKNHPKRKNGKFRPKLPKKAISESKIKFPAKEHTAQGHKISTKINPRIRVSKRAVPTKKKRKIKKNRYASKFKKTQEIGSQLSSNRLLLSSAS